MKDELGYSVVVRDRQGEVVSRERRKAKSFLKQWNEMMYAMMTTRNLQAKHIDGVVSTIGDVDEAFAMNGGIGIVDFGVVIGTGDTAVAIDDYALETLIAHGAGADQMSYAACTVSAFTVAPPSCSFVVTRTITNNSGVTITVKEAGLYMRSKSAGAYICGARDVFSAPQAVPDGGSITIDWTLKVTA